MGGAAPIPSTYRAEHGKNGEVIVRHVPVFAENVRKFGNTEVKFDRSWLAKALDNDKRLRATGYKAPMHFGHHEVATTRDRAGHYELESIELCSYQGREINVLFGSLVFSDEAAFNRALKNFPYRSVEIAGGDAPDQINSLALLSTEAPYFRFPNLENVTYTVSKDGTISFAWQDPIKFEFPPAKDGGDAKPKPKKGDKKKPAKKDGAKDDGAKRPAHNGGQPDQMAAADGDVAYDGDAEGDDGESEDGEAPAEFGADGEGKPAPHPSADVDLKKVVEQINGLCEIMKIIQDKFGSGHSEPDEDEDYADGEDTDGSSVTETEGGSMEVGVPVVAAKAEVNTAEIQKIIAKFEGIIDAQNAKIAKLEAERESEKLFATLKNELVNYSVPNLDKVLAEKVAKGADVARAWAAGIQEGSGAPIKRASEAPVDDTAGNTKPVVKDVAEVEAYAKYGAEVLAEARALAEIYEAAPKNHFMRKQALAAFLAAQPSLSEVK